MNGIIELQTANKWLIDADFGFKAMRLVNAMMRGHLLPKDEKVYQTLAFETADGGFLMSADADDDELFLSPQAVNTAPATVTKKILLL